MSNEKVKDRGRVKAVGYFIVAMLLVGGLGFGGGFQYALATTSAGTWDGNYITELYGNFTTGVRLAWISTGRVLYTTTGGAITSNAAFTFISNILSVPNAVISGDVNATRAFFTELGATRLTGAVDANGQDITGADNVTVETLYVNGTQVGWQGIEYPQQQEEYIIFNVAGLYVLKDTSEWLGYSFGTDFGALLNTAIAGLPANGGKISIGSGVFYYSSTALLNDVWINIEGSGWGTQLWASGGYTGNAFNVTQGGCRIAHLQIYGANTGKVGVYASTANAKSLLLDDLYIRDMVVAGIRHAGLLTDNPRYGITINDVLINSIAKTGGGIGIDIGTVGDMTYSTINNPRISDCGVGVKYNSAGSGSNNNYLSGGQITYCQNAAIQVYSDRVVITGGTKINHNVDYGIYGNGSDNLQIIGISVVANDDNIYITDANFPQIIGCDIHSGASSVITLNNCASPIVAENALQNSVVDVNLSGTTANADISNNRNINGIVNPSKCKTIFGNYPFVTENSGTFTILNATTSIVITHGMSYTPDAGDFTITWTENPTNDPGNWWIDTITATQATIHVRNDPGASNLDGAWSCEKR